MDSKHDHEHHKGMRCTICDGTFSVDEFEQWQQEKLEKCGFYIHCVDSPEDRYINAHTHGFQKTWGHHDFQLVLRLPEKVIFDIFWNFADRVKKGEVFLDGTKVDEIIKGYPVLMMAVREGDRDVMRIILPDPDGRFPGDPDVQPAFAYQANIGEEFFPSSN